MPHIAGAYAIISSRSVYFTNWFMDAVLKNFSEIFERGSPKGRPAHSAIISAMFIVYVLLSLKDNRTYVGFTNNFVRRFHEHNTRQAKATRSRAPFTVLFTEEFQTLKEAKHREIWWKSGAGRRELKRRFNNA
jgi:putative endonuclease